GDDGAGNAEPALAEDDRGVADVRAGQELAEADGFREIRLGQPAPLFHHRAIGPRQHAAEGTRADGEKAEEELAERARRRDLHFFLHNTSICVSLWRLRSSRSLFARMRSRCSPLKSRSASSRMAPGRRRRATIPPIAFPVGAKRSR